MNAATGPRSHPPTTTYEAAAASAGLTYVSPEDLDLHRRRSGRGFCYRDAAGRTVRDEEVLARIRSLVIPPAWRDVRISSHANGHLQAVGTDQKGRRQYRYHPQFRAVRDAAKFEHLIAFAEALPAVRARVASDLAGRGLGRERVLATVVRLLETTMIRVGSAAYARANRSYGVASLRSRHVEANGGSIAIHFKGKSGREWKVDLADRRLARIIRACQELPGQHLFQYVDEAGDRRSIGSADVNAYLKEASGRDISAKDFRTWWGTVLAASALELVPPCSSEAEAKQRLASVVREVAAELGNTPAVCRSCYIHPIVVADYLAGRLRLTGRRRGGANGLSRKEAAVLTLLGRPSHTNGLQPADAGGRLSPRRSRSSAGRNARPSASIKEA